LICLSVRTAFLRVVATTAISAHAIFGEIRGGLRQLLDGPFVFGSYFRHLPGCQVTNLLRISKVPPSVLHLPNRRSLWLSERLPGRTLERSRATSTRLRDCYAEVSSVPPQMEPRLSLLSIRVIQSPTTSASCT